MKTPQEHKLLQIVLVSFHKIDLEYVLCSPLTYVEITFSLILSFMVSNTTGLLFYKDERLKLYQQSSIYHTPGK